MFETVAETHCMYQGIVKHSQDCRYFTICLMKDVKVKHLNTDSNFIVKTVHARFVREIERKKAKSLENHHQFPRMCRA